ncbi:MAG: cyclase family protein [Acidimicrobiales bacterium]
MPLSDDLIELATRVSNRGRWGDDDQRGTLNLIDAAAVQRGGAAIRQGRAFSLAIPFDDHGPQTGGIPGRDNPTRTMNMINVAFTGDTDDFTTSDDAFSMGVQAATHWDALSHAGYAGLLYNAIPDTVISEAGAARLGIEHFGAVAGRGVLLDVARVHGVDHFDDNHAITGDDLDAAADLAGVTVEAGDIICVRTGQMHWLREGDKDRFGSPAPGLSTKSIPWLADHDIAAVATDNLTFEVFPSEDPAVFLPCHMIHLRDMGLVQGQLWALDELAADCAADGQYDFFLAATPLPLTGSVGGTVAPTAVK